MILKVLIMAITLASAVAAPMPCEDGEPDGKCNSRMTTCKDGEPNDECDVDPTSSKHVLKLNPKYI